jgi:N utilization substance protein B
VAASQERRGLAYRRRARIAAMHALYEMDIGGHDPKPVLERLILQYKLNEEHAAFARELLSGVLSHVSEIDGLISQTARERPLAEIPAVDRNLIRIAIRECVVDNLTPVAAAINEAVDLAKKYGSESSGRFVNGVLGSVSAARNPAREGE